MTGLKKCGKQGFLVQVHVVLRLQTMVFKNRTNLLVGLG